MASVSFEEVTFHYAGSEKLFESTNVAFGIPTSSMEERRGHILAVMGASGSGKTTLIRLVAGIEQPVAGRIVFASPENPTISYLPQKPVLFEHLTTAANARLFERIAAQRARFD